MATAIVVEFADNGKTLASHRLQATKYPAVTRQSVTFTTSVATTNAFQPETCIVLFMTDAPKAHYDVGVTPVATTSHEWVTENQESVFCVEPGSGLKIAFLVGA